MNLVRQLLYPIYGNVASIGFDENNSSEKQKRIKLLNIFCVFWLLIEMGSIITEDSLLTKPPIYFITHLANITGIIIVLLLQYLRNYKIALIIFFFFVFFSNFMFSNFINPGKLLEYCYLVGPSFVLLFTNNKYIIFTSFLLSVSLFIVPNIYLEHYPDGFFGPNYIVFTIFSIVFVLVYYFKHENFKSEVALENERKKLADVNTQQSQFFINVAHEIRTPLTLIKGLTNKLNSYNSTLKDQQVESIVSQLNHQSNIIKKIVDDVIDLAKIQSANFTINRIPINVDKLLKKIATSFESLFKQKHINFDVLHPTCHCYVLGDSKYFERALNNVILNALKYTDKNGNVTLQINEEKESITISIKDDGIGMEAEDLALIFNRFYQAKNHINKSGGSGVGLAFSKEIIENIGGKITVSSSPGKGSTFNILLPKFQNEQAENSVKAKQLTKFERLEHFSSANKKTCVLIVDDSYDMRHYVKDVLKEYDCVEAEDGLEALEKIKTNAVDFIVTDYMMPKMDGLELITRLKSMHHLAPILMLTARADSQIKLSILRLGIDDYLLKPFEEEELKIRIKNAVINNKKRTQYQLDEKIDLSNKDPKDDWIESMQTYIFEQSGKNKFTQADIAEHFNVSISSLFRRIKSETGLSPNELITEVRLQKAKHLLESRQVHSVKHLVLEVGFKHASYFSKKYYERFGSKPSFN